MLVVVTSVSFLVQIYSMGYMKGDAGYWRYFAYMSPVHGVDARPRPRSTASC